MKGDFTRSTFRAKKHYSSVRMQQGRVQLDADWNEQVDIAAHRTETETTDVVGRCGAPLDNAGFQLTGGPVPAISPGRYYVDGILCENEASVSLDAQPDLPVSALADLITPECETVEDGHYLAYLDVWQRHITALEDEAIREVALGGPDTATRTQTIWQVKLLGPLSDLTCASEPPEWTELLDTNGRGALSAQATPSGPAPGPCEVPPGAGYRRLENQLYRVEIHRVNQTGKVTCLKWSRDNGSVVARWLDQDASKPEDLIVSTIGRDEVSRFGPNQYAEVVDDQRELRGEAGILVKLLNAQGDVLTLDGNDPNASTVHKADFPDAMAGRPNNPKVRRWDGVILTPDAGVWLDLEDGVQIKLEAGKYQIGDYWLIPARTATGDVEWPREGTPPAPIPEPRMGLQHHYCKLAVLDHAGGSFTVVEGQDCRVLFPPLTGMTTLLYAGGDGQEALPGETLGQPLRVRVDRGGVPVKGASVKFEVKAGDGTLTPGPSPAPIATSDDGTATCFWTLGAVPDQRVEAALLDAGGSEVSGQIVYFSANLSLASQVHYDGMPGSNLAGDDTVQKALDGLAGLPHLYYVSGDGQDAPQPDLVLPLPVAVTVANDSGVLSGGGWRVVFEVEDGAFVSAAPDLPDPSAGSLLEVTTAMAGEPLKCYWQLSPHGGSTQCLTATLSSDVGEKIGLPAEISFTANVRATGGGDGKGIRIDNVVLLAGGDLHNDRLISSEQLSKGIRIDCERDLFQGSVQNTHGFPNPVVTVALELPWPLLGDEHEYWNVGHAPVGFQSVTVSATVRSDGGSIYWQPGGPVAGWLAGLMQLLGTRTNGAVERVLARLKVRGNFIWGPAEQPDLYLDGETFGTPGSGQVELDLPSGDGRRGGDFEMWFWLVHETVQPDVCGTNMKAIWMAAQAYVADHEKLPDPQKWVDELLPYVHNVAVFKCPADHSEARCSYALHLPPADQELHVLLFETSHPGDNPVGDVDDVIAPARHHGGNYYGFTDGHVEWLAAVPPF